VLNKQSLCISRRLAFCDERIMWIRITMCFEVKKVSEEADRSSALFLNYWFYGASEGTRTLDLRFTKPMLYQLSYAGLFSSVSQTSQNI
jgi:hypothetical protein